MEVINPHDKFFKENFSDKEIATDFIKWTFPKELLENLDLSKLKLDNNSYIDEKLKEYYSDLVYDCEYKTTKVKISILFEHKSYVPDYPFLQLLKYLIKIWDYNIKQKQNLMPVIPIVFYHGVEKWEYKMVSDYFDGIDDQLRLFIPNFRYLLTDLSGYTDNEIKNNIFKNAILKVIILIMKNIFDEEKLQKNLEKILIIGKLYYEEEKGLKFLESIIRYLYTNLENVKVDDIVEIIKKISEIRGDESMTIAMKLKQEGRDEGIIKGKIEAAINMFKEGISLEIISKCTGVNKNELDEILKNNNNQNEN